MSQSSAVEKFRALHESGCFILPNPWDAGTAIYLKHVGFKAVATTSAGFAFSKGLPDGSPLITLEMMLDHFREIAGATSLPVNADFLNGYADEPERVAANVAKCTSTGVAGLSIEDSTGSKDTPLYDFDLAVERVRRARAAIDSSGTGVLLTARCEAHLVGYPDPLGTSLDRLVAFADAGADCLYAPGITEPDEIDQIVKAVAPKPVNVLVFMKNCNLTVSQLEDLGVRRISVGSGLARAAWTGVINTAGKMRETGTFTALGDATGFNFNELFGARS
ncbi:MAG TPA: isocitrate lyase/phosphoenolpyruvate mutase family protein [Pyrinomonadaceae bacterium]